MTMGLVRFSTSSIGYQNCDSASGVEYATGPFKPPEIFVSNGCECELGPISRSHIHARGIRNSTMSIGQLRPLWVSPKCT